MQKNQEIIYQINPHMFTPTGTLLEASKMLPHLQKTGVTMVYLFAIWKADDSMDERFWSERQKKSGLNNPKNPYRIADYFQVDEDYGGNEQRAVFIKKAHQLGLKVMLDLVYYHCAPNAN